MIACAIQEVAESAEELQELPRDACAVVGIQDLASQFTLARVGRACGAGLVPPELLRAAQNKLPDCSSR